MDPFRRVALPLLLSSLSLLVAVGCGPADVGDEATQGASALSSWYCGTQCQGRAPTWKVPSKGIECAASKKEVGAGIPNAALARDLGHKGFNAPDLTVKVFYSTRCQTLWAEVHNSGQAVTGQDQCEVVIAWNVPGGAIRYECPRSGRTLTTAMVVDHSATGAEVSSANLHVSRGSGSKKEWADFEYDY